MQILNIFHVLIAIAMVALILIQKGAGATAGAAFGSGASGTVFGSRGAGNFLTRSTWVLATLFCLISLTMAVMASRASMAPETDLGVIANTLAIEEVATEDGFEQTAQDMPIFLNDAESSDIPSIDALISEVVEDANAGDLPAIEDSAASDDEDL